MYGLFVLLLLFQQGVACAPEPPTQEKLTEPTEGRSEPLAEPAQEPPLADAEPPFTDAGPEPPKSEPLPDAVPDGRGEPIPEPTPEPSPTRCATGEACNAPLTESGLCPGACLAQPTKTTCTGTVKFGLCYQKPPNLTNPDLTIHDLLLQPGNVPDVVQEGSSVQLQLKVTNKLAQTRSLPFSYQISNDWELQEASFKDWTTLDLKANEVVTLTMKLKALKANLFTTSGLNLNHIISLSFNREPYTFVGKIGFPPTGNKACGSNYFPERYCPTTPGCSTDRRHYVRGKCCEEVFYPGANCCTNADCQSGGCFAGKCAPYTPFGLANTIARGHHRVLIVLSDFLNLPSDPSKLCQNRYTELKEMLKLDAFETYFKTLSQRYTQTDGPRFQWVVLAGLNTDDFNKGGGRTSTTMHQALETHLIAKGCIKDTNEFDKRVLITSMADLGPFTGKANTGGLVTMKKIDMYLFAHELAHTYGATDLYLDQGGKLQWLHELMGNNLGAHGVPLFHVARGEILWGDANQNGVIDAFDYAVYPDALVAKGLKAAMTQKSSIEITADVKAMVGGVEKDLLLRRMTIELPEYNQSSTGVPGRTTVWVDGPVDLDAIRQKGTIKVVVKATYTFSKKDFTRQTLTLNFTKDLPVTQ